MYDAVEYGTEIDFVLVGKGNRKYLRDVTDLIKKKVKMVIRKEAIKSGKAWKLKKDDTRTKLEGRVREVVSADALDLWNCFKEGVLKACDEVCGKKNGRRD